MVKNHRNDTQRPKAIDTGQIRSTLLRGFTRDIGIALVVR